MTADMTKALRSSMIRSLEELAFTWPEDPEDVVETLEGTAADPVLEDTVFFDIPGNPGAWHYDLKISRSVLPILVSNMLGESVGFCLAEADLQDGMRELTNVLCGNFIPEMWGSETESVMATPCIVPAFAPDARVTAVARVQLIAEGGRVVATVRHDASEAL